MELTSAARCAFAPTDGKNDRDADVESASLGSPSGGSKPGIKFIFGKDSLESKRRRNSSTKTLHTKAIDDGDRTRPICRNNKESKRPGGALLRNAFHPFQVLFVDTSLVASTKSPANTDIILSGGLGNP